MLRLIHLFERSNPNQPSAVISNLNYVSNSRPPATSLVLKYESCNYYTILPFSEALKYFVISIQFNNVMWKFKIAAESKLDSVERANLNFMVQQKHFEQRHIKNILKVARNTDSLRESSGRSTSTSLFTILNRSELY